MACLGFLTPPVHPHWTMTARPDVGVFIRAPLFDGNYHVEGSEGRGSIRQTSHLGCGSRVYGRPPRTHLFFLETSNSQNTFAIVGSLLFQQPFVEVFPAYISSQDLTARIWDPRNLVL